MRTSFQVKDITIHRIVEEVGAHTPFREFFPTLTDEMLAENRHWLEPVTLDPKSGMIRLTYQSYVVKTPQHTVLLDTCIGNDKTRPARPVWTGRKDEHFMRGLAAIGVSPDEIDFVMCTHLHVDHVGWNTKLENGRWVPTFPKARYLFSKKELDHWDEVHKATPLAHYEDSVLPVVAAGKVDFVATDHQVNDYVSLMPTPGHSFDHYAVKLGKGGKDALYTGDAIHSLLQLKYPDLPMRADYDGAQGAASRRRMLEEIADTPTLCCAAHFPEPSVGLIKRDGKGFRCEFVT